MGYYPFLYQKYYKKVLRGFHKDFSIIKEK